MSKFTLYPTLKTSVTSTWINKVTDNLLLFNDSTFKTLTMELP